MTKALKEMILGALDDAGGQQYLARQADENPVAFMGLLGKVLPTTLANDKQNPLFAGETVASMEARVVDALIAKGMSEDEARAAITET